MSRKGAGSYVFIRGAYWEDGDQHIELQAHHLPDDESEASNPNPPVVAHASWEKQEDGGYLLYALDVEDSHAGEVGLAAIQLCADKLALRPSRGRPE